jgi:peptidoglycan/LPS O-acetylase OafA/YrhL
MTIAYRPDIDGLRAVAVLSVVGFHAFPKLFPGGFIGVDIFFVISGYLITSILLTESSNHGIQFLAFYARRIVRIFPALILVLAASLFVGWHTLLAVEYKQLGKHIAAGAAFVSNFSLWFEAGYFDRASESKPLLHLWSLAIEEQFYIVWPFLLWLVLKARAFASRTVIALVFASLIFASVLVFQDQTQAFYSPLTRAWELLSGALLAQTTLESSRPSALRQRRWLSVLGLFMIVGGLFLINARYPFPGLLALVPVVSAMLLIASPPSAWANRLVLANPVLVKIGLISYPLYLWHWPLLSFAFIVESGRPSAGIRLLMVVIAFALATLTYHWVEKPIKKLPRRLAIVALVVLMALLGFLGKNVYDRDGLERIRHKNLIAMSEAANEDFTDFEKRGLITEAKCARPFKFPERDVCLMAHPERIPTVAVIGDSHALHAYWGLAEAFDRKGDNLVLLGRGACVPFMNFKADGDAYHCQPHINDTFDFVAADPDIKTVLIIFRGRYVSEHSSPTVQEMFRAGLDQTLRKLTNAKKQVYYFLPVVEPGFDPRLCIGKLPLGRKPPFGCDIVRAADDLKSQFMRETVLSVVAAYPQVKIVDPNVYLCSNGVCPIIVEGHSVFKDENHLSYFGSLILGRSVRFN